MRKEKFVYISLATVLVHVEMLRQGYYVGTREA